MRSKNEQPQEIESPPYRELRMLSEVEDNPQVTQRDLSRRVGTALGLTNLLMRTLAQKGYVRVTRAGWNRCIYNLTPKGLSRKLHLTVDYIHRILDHYQYLRQSLRDQLQPLALHEESRVAVLGVGEFAELVYLGLRDIGIEEIDFFAPTAMAGGRLLGMPVRDVAELRPEQYDRVVMGHLNGRGMDYLDKWMEGIPSGKIITFFGERESGEGA